jgi:hypothetical protein
MNHVKSMPIYKTIDWTKVQSGRYAVLDPSSSAGILYLSDNQYLSLVRVAASNDLELVILARPYERPDSESSPSPSSTNSTLHDFSGFISNVGLHGFKKVGGLIDLLYRKVKSDAVDHYRMNITPLEEHPVYRLFLLWGDQLHLWTKTADSSRKSAQARQASLIFLARFIAKMVKHQGVATTAVRLKIYLVALNHFLAGTSLTDTTELGL